MSYYVDMADVNDIIMHGAWSDEHELIDEIKSNATFANVRKVRGGYWKGDGQFYYVCSECGYNASFKFNFCPNCGTDMRG